MFVIAAGDSDALPDIVRPCGHSPPRGFYLVWPLVLALVAGRRALAAISLGAVALVTIWQTVLFIEGAGRLKILFSP